MKIRKRLLEIAEIIPCGSKIIDVGADHGLLSIYLAKYKNCHCLATDISDKCLDRARKNSVKYSTQIDFLVTDGLNGIKLFDEIIIIAGMGTRNIKKILNFDLDNDLVIMSHTDILELEEFLEEKNYKIILEKEFFDKHKYTLIKASKKLF